MKSNPQHCSLQRKKELCNKGQVLIYLGWLTYKVYGISSVRGGGGGGGGGGESVQFS